MSTSTFNHAPTNADLPLDHPFRNAMIMADIQIRFPKWKPMTDAEYLAKPYLHPINAGLWELQEVFPPYHFREEEFPGGKADWAKIEWPSHAYYYENEQCCEQSLAVLQVSGAIHGEDHSLIQYADSCFGCELRIKGLKSASGVPFNK